MERKKVLCIIGSSGSGKTTIERLLEQTFPLHFKRLVSYTTRPMREGETQGVEHQFVKCLENTDDQLAYTKYGDYEYWAKTSDIVPGKVNTYVIDVEGFRFLQRYFADKLEIRVMYVKRSKRDDIDEDRKERDRDRLALTPDDIDILFRNEGSISDLIANVRNNFFGYIMSVFNENTGLSMDPRTRNVKSKREQ
ncbi:MAG: hypothetical protein MR924_12770 [Prevotella sp.]|nr:hypothetical protein [Prevotella sp.]